MLRINRVKIEIETNNGLYGFDSCLQKGLNIIASDDNTRGKTSIIETIFYCLGCEELLGGQGAKTLTSVFKTELEDDDGKVHLVLQSCSFLEIFNGKDVVTIYRTIKNEKREENLVTVFFSDMNKINNANTNRKDFYVLLKNSATSKNGFHKFLNDFLDLNLPIVYDNNDDECKLYIQQVIAALFIEQKGGWTDLLHRVPYYKMPNAKLHVMEYWYGVNRSEVSHKRRANAKKMSDVITKWNHAYMLLKNKLDKYNGNIINYPLSPQIMTDDLINSINIMFDDYIIKEYMINCQSELTELQKSPFKIKENFGDLQNELRFTEEKMSEIHIELEDLKVKRLLEKQHINKQKHNLEQIENDIQNNKDAKCLKSLGSNLNLSYTNNSCPLCHQHIEDILLPFESNIMSIDENIKHLKAQKDMLEFSINSHSKKLEKINNIIENNENVLRQLERLSFSLRTDIYSTEQCFSETAVRKKVELTDKIEDLSKIYNDLNDLKKEIKDLSELWRSLLTEKENLKSDNIENINEKIDYARKIFVKYLYDFNFSSIPDAQRIDISPITLLPCIDNFDMKFESSASDNIRIIWAYTLSILNFSNLFANCKLNISIFDEPKQQSIINDDFEMFLNKILEICNECNSQVILGVTSKDDTKNVLDNLEKETCNIINVIGKAFKKI